MFDIETMKMIERFGMSIGVFLLCAWLVKHIAVNLCAKMDDSNKALIDVVDATNELRKTNDEAHRYQRAEHEAMMTRLNNIKS
jgi:hypothetical protein